MIEAIEFSNFKALRQTTLPLAPFTLLLGPNGSGKSSVLQALRETAAVAAQPHLATQSSIWSTLLSITAEDGKGAVQVKLRLRFDERIVIATFQWDVNGQATRQLKDEDGTVIQGSDRILRRRIRTPGEHSGETPTIMSVTLDWLRQMQVYALDANAIAGSVAVNSGPLKGNGSGLAAVLDDLKDNHPNRWESLLDEVRSWLPEYDHILFDKPTQGHKAIVLRTKKGGHRIPARDLSQGTLVALALLTLAYLPDPPSLVGLEEIDRGLHPRLLRHLRDALYRLSYPENYGEKRSPIQVIATTHSPYLLDLYREHPEEVVLAHKEGLEVVTRRLSDIEHYQEIVGESPLSEVWYSGVLGGVAVKP